MPDDLYARDIVVWSRHQAELLRRLAAGERLNEPVDWPNVIEEVESLGKSQVQACEALLLQAVVHLIKMRLYPQSDAQAGWGQEAAAFLTGARRRYTPSMRQLFDLDDIYKDAVRQLRAASDDRAFMDQIPRECSYDLADLFAEDLRIRDLVAKLAA